MLNHRKTIPWMILSAFACIFVIVQPVMPGESLFEYEDLFDYDHKQPLNPEMHLIEKNADYELYNVEYGSVWNRRVDGLLMIPEKGVPPYPCVVFGHGYNEDKNDAGSLLGLMAEEEICVLSINARYNKTHTAHSSGLFDGLVYQGRDEIVSTVIDMDRGIDFLETRIEVNTERIVFVGRGLGSIPGQILMSKNNRVSASVMIDGVDELGCLLTSEEGKGLPGSEEEEIIQINNRIIREIISPVEPLNYIDNASGKHVLFVSTNADNEVAPCSLVPLMSCLDPKRTEVLKGMEGTVLYKEVAEWTLERLNGVDKQSESQEGPAEEEAEKKESACKEHERHGNILDIEHYYGYDSALPLLSYRINAESYNRKIQKYKINFRSVNDKTAMLELSIPKEGVYPFPAVIYVHGRSGKAEDSQIIEEILTRNGIASVTMDIAGGKTAEAEEGMFSGGTMDRQMVVDLRRAMDVLDTIMEINGGEYTIYAEREGVFTAIEAAAVDDRVRAIIMKDVKRGKGHKMGEIRLKKTIEQLKNVYIMEIETIENNNSEDATEQKLYEMAKEPKERVGLDRKSPAIVSRLMKTVIVFMKNMYDTKNNEELADMKRKVTVEEGLISMDAGPHHKKNGEYDTRVSKISIEQVKRGSSAEIVIKAKVEGTEEKDATVVAILEKRNGINRYVQLMDNGMGADPRADDGEYCGILKNPGLEIRSEYHVIVGGVGKDGGDIGGMEKVKTFITK